jgi:hypothetical protein
MYRADELGRHIMDINLADTNLNAAGVVQLCEAYRALNALRIGLDLRIMGLPPDADGREELWAELEAHLARMSDIAGRLTMARATRMTQLRAKAGILATLLRDSDTGGNDIMPERKMMDLALSLADDIADFPRRTGSSVGTKRVPSR